MLSARTPFLKDSFGNDETILSLSFTAAIEVLLKGATLEWPKFQDHKAGAIALPSAAARRLFQFLLAQPASKLVAPDETIFNGLLGAWKRADDPAASAEEATTPAQAQSWRLAKLEASAFGGLTIFGGPTFELLVEEENWCLEGQNGSGKPRMPQSRTSTACN